MTLVEVLVVVGIVAVLASIAFPAISALRESARRTACQSHLRQIGQALAAYEASWRVYPALSYPGNLTRFDPVIGMIGEASSSLSPFTYLLPHLGYQQVYDLIDLNHDGGSYVNDFHYVNREAQQVVIPEVLCPSDASDLGFKANVSYRFNAGVSRFSTAGRSGPGVAPDGAFANFVCFRPRDFRDGLSQTIGLSEKRLGSGDVRRFDPRRDFWHTNAHNDFNDPSSVPDESFLEYCERHFGPDVSHYPFAGFSWMSYGFENTIYNHLLTPNAEMPDCSMGHGPNPSYHWSQGGIFTAGSQHSGGVHSLFMDGSVRWIENGIALALWRAYSTKNGGPVPQ